MKQFILSTNVRKAIITYGWEIHGISPEYLINTTTFYDTVGEGIIDWLLDKRWGFTRDAHTIIMTDEFFANCKEFALYCAKIWHELIHIAQMRAYGQENFRLNYFWQWLTSGFSYSRMKKRGYEKEAYDAERLFYEKASQNNMFPKHI